MHKIKSNNFATYTVKSKPCTVQYTGSKSDLCTEDTNSALGLAQDAKSALFAKDENRYLLSQNAKFELLVQDEKIQGVSCGEGASRAKKK